jgi:hypothetical protein
MSIAWSYDVQGPVKGSIAVVSLHRDPQKNLICYDVPKALCTDMPHHIKSILEISKYLGVVTNAQLDATDGKEKILSILSQ